MPKKVDRRRFLETAGRIGAGTVLGSIPLLYGCKGSPTTPEEPPEPPVPVDLDFTVYNHTQGPRGSFRKTGVMSGTTVEWSVPSLIADLGITDVYEKGIVIRDAVSGARVCVTRDGNVGRVIAPRQNTSFDIILFNIEGRTFYDVAYSGRWLSTPPFGSSARAYRKDFDGLAGEERVWGGEFLPEIGEYGVFDQFNKALNPDWSAWSYGNIERKPAPNDEKGEFGYGYGDCIGYDSDVFLPSFRGFYWCGIDPRRVPDIRTQIVRGLGDASMLMTGVTFRRAFGQEDYQIIQENGILKQAFKDFLCYWFLVT